MGHIDEYAGLDVYTVQRQGNVATVLHYQDEKTEEPCCRTTVTVTDDDRRLALGDDSSGWITALTRAHKEIEARHGWRSA
jgi:hypothetical protein